MSAPRRPEHEMPEAVRKGLAGRGPRAAFEARPPCPRNDCPDWIAAARRPETRARRPAPVVAEREAGRGHMGMDRRPGR